MVTRWRPMGLGRSEERVANTPVNGVFGSPRGCVCKTLRTARCSHVRRIKSCPGVTRCGAGANAASISRSASGAPSNAWLGASRTSRRLDRTIPICRNDELASSIGVHLLSAPPTGLVMRRARWESSAHRFLHERDDPFLLGGGQLLEREGGRPHVAVVEVRRVLEAERRVPRLELLRALEEADNLAVLGVGGHPVPGPRP